MGKKSTHFSKEIWSKVHAKMFNVLIMKEIQIKSTMSYNFPHTRMVTLRQTTINVDEGGGN